jgi:lysophospholipase L1-like esterase
VGRAANIALAVFAVVDLAAAVYVVRANHAPSSSAAPPPAVQVTSSPATATGSLGVDATSATQAAGDPVIAFLGDDWTVGVGAGRRAERFSTLLCRQLPARERNFGVPGTGYAKTSDAGGAYQARVEAVVAAHPQVVVVSGGRNDRSDYPATAADAARRLFATLHTRLPDAVLVAVAPFWGDSDLPPEMVALGRAVEQGVTAAGGTYLDVPDPIHGHPTLMADDADPNAKGYAAIAAALEPQLAPLLPA